MVYSKFKLATSQKYVSSANMKLEESASKLFL